MHTSMLSVAISSTCKNMSAPMISDDDVKILFQNIWRLHGKYYDPSKPNYLQFRRGIDSLAWEGQHPGSCLRHLSVFDMFHVIPRYCFNCYKVSIKPRTVLELFKLMVVFDKLDLPNNNSRKCSVETRKQVPGFYSGLIYCRSIEEGKIILETVKSVISEEISRNIPIMLKRGCSEYAIAYPKFAQIEHGESAMEYNEEWQEYENRADQVLANNPRRSVSNPHNPKAYTTQDAIIMFGWLKYAATIGDTSYLNISWKLQPFKNLERPYPFHSEDDE